MDEVQTADVESQNLKPERIGHRWSPQEELLLRAAWDGDDDLSSVCARHQRTASGVLSHYVKMGLAPDRKTARAHFRSRMAKDDQSVIVPLEGDAERSSAWKRWSPEEDDKLRSEWDDGLGLDEITSLHGRTSNAILNRLIRTLHVCESVDEARAHFGMPRLMNSQILGRWKGVPGAYDELMNVINATEPLLIVIDGKDGHGKTTLSAWLSWQLGCPVIHTDLHIVQPNEQESVDWTWRDHAAWRHDEIENMLSARLDRERPRRIIIEGVLVQDRLDAVGRSPNLVIWVEQPEGEDEDTLDDIPGDLQHSILSGLRHGLIEPYIQRRNPYDSSFIFRVADIAQGSQEIQNVERQAEPGEVISE